MRVRGDLLALAGVMILAASCGDDPPEACMDTCDLCCAQAADCSGADRDACYADCVASCERSERVYSHTPCFDAKVALMECACALTCSELSAWEMDASTSCSAEASAEADGCAWF